MPKAAHVCAASLATSVGQTSSRSPADSCPGSQGKEWDYVRPASKSQGLRGTKWLVCGIQYLWHRSQGGMQTQGGAGSTSPRGMAGAPWGGTGSEWRQRRPFHVSLTLVTMLMHTLCCKPQGRDRLGEACRDALVWGLE